MKTFSIRFSRDMPPAAVEVIGPDLRRVSRAMLEGNGSRDFEAPPSSFARIHLPDGRVAVIRDVASLKEAISLEMLSRQGNRRPQTPKTVVAEQEVLQPGIRRRETNESVNAAWDDSAGRVPTFGPRWRWRLDGMPARTPPWNFTAPWGRPHDLMGTFGGATVQVRLPATTNYVSVNVSATDHQAGIEVRTFRQKADWLVNRLHAGDVDGAKAFLEGIAKADYAAQIVDPDVAIAAAYLLLRLSRFDELMVWTADYLDQFPRIPDSTVIRAWVQLHRDADTLASPGEMFADAGEMFADAARHQAFPVYTEGLRLLIDGLHATGREEALAALQSRLGLVVWTSPLTTTINISNVRSPIPSIVVDFPRRTASD